jgi:hypothetical protein
MDGASQNATAFWTPQAPVRVRIAQAIRINPSQRATQQRCIPATWFTLIPGHPGAPQMLLCVNHVSGIICKLSVDKHTVTYIGIENLENSRVSHESHSTIFWLAHQGSINERELLAEVEDLLRTMPNGATLASVNEENFSWPGRVAAFVDVWDPMKSPILDLGIGRIHSNFGMGQDEGINSILVLLHKARAGIRMSTFGPTNLAVEVGRLFDYFNEIRKVIETAKKDVFFIYSR